MSKYGSPDTKIEVDDTDLSQYIHENVDIDIEALTEEGHGFGKVWVGNLATGIKKGNEFTLAGLYDDTAVSGPDAVLNDVGATKTVKVTMGGGKYVQVDAIVKNYKRTFIRGELHKFSATMLPSGEVSEA